MPRQEQLAASIFDINLRTETIALGLAIAFTFATTLLAAPAAQSQTFAVLHTFTGGADGSGPGGGGITSDSAGNLYGVTVSGGVYSPNCIVDGAQNGCGTAYKMTHRNGAWTFNVLYSFDAEGDGYSPDQILAVATDGSLYGSTFYGPSTVCPGNGCGTVFRLRPQPTFCTAVSCPWKKRCSTGFRDIPMTARSPPSGT